MIGCYRTCPKYAVSPETCVWHRSNNQLVSCMISDRFGPCHRLPTLAAPIAIEELVIYHYIGLSQPANVESPRL